MADDPETAKPEDEGTVPPTTPAPGGNGDGAPGGNASPIFSQVGWQGTMVFLILLALLAWGTKSSKTYEADPIATQKTYVAKETRSFIEQMADPATARGVITLLFSMGTIWIAIQLMSHNSRISDEKFNRGKDVLTILVGLLGTVFGFYFGSLSEQNSQMQAALEQRLDDSGAINKNSKAGQNSEDEKGNENAGGDAGASADGEVGEETPQPEEPEEARGAEASKSGQ